MKKKRIKTSELRGEKLHAHVKKLERKAKKERRVMREVNIILAKRDTRAYAIKRNWTSREPLDQKLYIVTAGESFKIGIALKPHDRLREIQTGNPIKCVMRAYWTPEYARALETRMHASLRNHRLNGEWFCGSVLDRAISRITEIVGKEPDFSLEPSDSAKPKLAALRDELDMPHISQKPAPSVKLSIRELADAMYPKE